MTAPVRIVVRGNTVSQGSMKHLGKGRVVHSKGKRLKAWRDAVAWAAKAAMVGRKPYEKTPLVLSATFYVEHDGSLFGLPIGQQHGDLSKMIRAIEDALGGQKRTKRRPALPGIVFDDDARIAKITDVAKEFAKHKPGAVITVREWTEADRSTVLSTEVG